MSNTCQTCFNTSCPEVVPVTIEEIAYTITGAAVTLALVQDSATQVTITFTSSIEDFQNFDCYFVDGPLTPGDKTISAPPTPGWIEKVLTSEADGTLSLVISNTGALDTWYLVLQGLNGVLVISDAITIGV